MAISPLNLLWFSDLHELAGHFHLPDARASDTTSTRGCGELGKHDGKLILEGFEGGVGYSEYCRLVDLFMSRIGHGL